MRPCLNEAADRREIHPEHNLAEVSEWIARILISLGTMPGDTFDPDNSQQVRGFIDRYVMPALVAAPIC